MKFTIEQSAEYHEMVAPILDTGIVFQELEEMLADKESFLGDGKTSSVHTLKGNNRLCMKVIDEQRMLEYYGYEKPVFNDINEESRLANLAGSIGKDLVRIPTPYIAWRLSDTEGNRDDVLIMEALNAVTLKSIHAGEASMPEGFDIDTFFDNLKKYLEMIHSQLGIYHRDIAEGNILVSKDTGGPCLIDFGDSIKVTGDEEPYVVRNDFGKTLRSYRDDINALQEVRKRLEAKLASKTSDALTK
jgi:serine/threonine protein kinase